MSLQTEIEEPPSFIRLNQLLKTQSSGGGCVSVAVGVCVSDRNTATNLGLVLVECFNGSETFLASTRLHCCHRQASASREKSPVISNMRINEVNEVLRFQVKGIALRFRLD